MQTGQSSKSTERVVGTAVTLGNFVTLSSNAICSSILRTYNQRHLASMPDDGILLSEENTSAGVVYVGDISERPEVGRAARLRQNRKKKKNLEF